MQDVSSNSPHPFQRLLLIAPFFLWGTAMVAMKGVMDHSSPLFVGTLRILPAGLLVVLVSVWMGKPQPKGWLAWLWIVGFALVDGTLFQGFLATGLSRTGAGLGSVMIDSQPLAVAVLAWLLYGEQVRFWGWLGLCVGILGISCIGLPDEWIIDLFGGHLVWPQSATSASAALGTWFSSGESWMLMAALSMAIGTVMIRRVCQHVDPVAATGWHMAIGGLPLMLGSFLWETHQWQDLTLNNWLAMSYSTIFGSAIAYGLFFFFASTGNLTSLSALTFLTPVFALIFGNWFLAEILSPIQFFGVGLTLVSIYLVNQRDRLPMLWGDHGPSVEVEQTTNLDSAQTVVWSKPQNVSERSAQDQEIPSSTL